MIIIIPIGGIGNRFKNQTNIPKALIEVAKKPIICYLLNNLINYLSEISFIYIPYNYNEYRNYNFEDFLIKTYPQLKFVFFKLMENTCGCASTIYISLQHLINQNKTIENLPILSIDSDNFYKIDIIKLWNRENKIFTFKDYNLNENPKFSYVKFNNNNLIEIIKEKEFIDNNKFDFNYACCGAYGFNTVKELFIYSAKIINNENNKVNNEYYISSIIKEMINDGYKFINETIHNKYYFSLGTPEQIKKYEYLYLFDLDGTLIDSDNLYLKIWNKLLNDFYNYSIDKDFFDNYIKGYSDDFFLKSLIPNIDEQQLKLISNLKDELFIKSINEINFYNGSIDFLKKLQNNNIAIVSNCNKKTAMTIINSNPYLIDLISHIITADDCKEKKPNPEPYLNAIKTFDKENNFKLIAFEDSKIGYLSAKRANIEKIFMKINDNNNNNYEQSFNNYNELNIDNLYSNENNDNYTIIKDILCDFLIKINKNKFNKDEKTGYISQINSYKIINNKKKFNVILKLPNYNNSLVFTANKLELFNNEYYFYKYLAFMIKNIINIPKCLGVCNKTKCILMEDLTKKYKGVFNINLNDNIDILLNVIKNISILHNTFIITNENTNINLCINNVKKINEYIYYKELIDNRYEKFKLINSKFIDIKTIKLLDKIINENFDKIINKLSEFPLMLCHGDLKSPNIYYKNFNEPYFLDFQYINLSKGTTDIIFLLCESIIFNKNITELVLNYYYLLVKNNYISYNDYLNNIRMSLCIFPLFVCIWFNTENNNNLNDKLFPLKFMKNFINYFEYLINDDFIYYLSII